MFVITTLIATVAPTLQTLQTFRIFSIHCLSGRFNNFVTLAHGHLNPHQYCLQLFSKRTSSFIAGGSDSSSKEPLVFLIRLIAFNTTIIKIFFNNIVVMFMLWDHLDTIQSNHQNALFPVNSLALNGNDHHHHHQQDLLVERTVSCCPRCRKANFCTPALCISALGWDRDWPLCMSPANKGRS